MADQQHEQHDAPALFSQKEAARYLSVSEMTLRNWRLRKVYDIPYVRLGRQVRYRKADLDSLIQDNLCND